MIQSWDARRDYFIGSDREEALRFAVEHWIHSAQKAIQQRGRFAVALSGGSTPQAIYEKLAETGELDWSKIWLFWSDERSVAKDHPESNYRMAMESFSRLPIPPSQIFRMKGEGAIEQNALDYEEKIRRILGKNLFDLVMLGIGEDGHTASLFPGTPGIEAEANRLAIANYIEEKKTWRMTLTFSCINQSLHSAVYAFGASKQHIVAQSLKACIESPFPISRIGTENHKSLWILDSEAATLIFNN